MRIAGLNMKLIYDIEKRVNALLHKNFSSEAYWIARYAEGGNSGAGSYGKLATYKASILNEFVNKYQVKSVIEYGCGDGNQLKLAKYPNYLGFDVSPAAISSCKDIFQFDKSKNFKLMKDYNGERAELILSLDVIFHLVEYDIFESYIKRLFESSNRFVIIYSSDADQIEERREFIYRLRKFVYRLTSQGLHEKHRKFTNYINQNINGWKLISYIPNKYPYNPNTGEVSISNFYVYEKFSEIDDKRS